MLAIVSGDHLSPGPYTYVFSGHNRLSYVETTVLDMMVMVLDVSSLTVNHLLLTVRLIYVCDHLAS